MYTSYDDIESIGLVSLWAQLVYTERLLHAYDLTYGRFPLITSRSTLFWADTKA